MTIESTIDANNKLIQFLKESPYDDFSLKTLSRCPEYELKRIVEFANDYDDTGELTLLYLVSGCKQFINDTRVSVELVLENPDVLKPYVECKEIINSTLVKNCRQNIVDKLSAMISMISGKNLLGDGSSIDKVLDDVIDVLFDGFRKLKFEVYANSGQRVDSFDRFSGSIQICNSLAEMLLRLEQSPDGIYVGYISNPGTLDGWFGFFCKSNGNMFSYNERINEAYVGQHSRLRNGGYAESKAYDLFPYELCNFSDDCDYKGYAKSVSMGDNRELFDMKDFSIFIRTVLSMAVISRKHAGQIVDGNVVIVNSLLPSNLAMIGGEFKNANALVKIDGSQLVKNTTSFKIPQFEEDKVLRGYYDHEFVYGEKRKFGECGWFNGVNQDMVDVYGNGFKINHDNVLRSNSSLRLIGDGQTEQEFVGSPERFRLQAYMEVRTQLAKYIQTKLYEDFEKFGGVESLIQWYKDKLHEKFDNVISRCVDVYHQWSNDHNKTFVKYGVDEVQNVKDNFRTITHPSEVQISEKPLFGFCLSEYKDGNFICPISHHKASIYFRFKFYTYKQVQEFLDCELPKFCVGWRTNSLYNGNSLLSVTDPVGNIENPIRGKFDFSFSVAFSKRAINAFKKE